MRLQSPYRAITVAAGVLVAMTALLAVAIGASAALLPGCTGCHMKGSFAVASEQAPHAGTECRSCHGGQGVAERVEFGTKQVLGMYLRVIPLDPTTAAVPDKRCVACHDLTADVVSESAGLRILHSACAVGRECDDCHSPTAHGAALSWPRSATMEMCYECHGTESAAATCGLCHVERLPSERVSTGTFAPTHGPDYLKTHGMGGMQTCVSCHESSKCAGCHGVGVPHARDFTNGHTLPAKAAGAKCLSCHVETFCTDCHKYQMPHPTDFVKTHADVAERDGKEGCRVCHDQADCEQCHLDHVHPVTLDQLRAIGQDVPSGGSE